MKFSNVIKELSKKGLDTETLARLEHIRWCRFHYLNFWKYDSVRDNAKKLHPRLLPLFDELPEKEREKDRNFVEKILNKSDSSPKEAENEKIYKS